MNVQAGGTWILIYDLLSNKPKPGRLEIQVSDQRLTAIDGHCTYKYIVIEGKYTSESGGHSSVKGTVGGYDPELKTTKPCKTFQKSNIFLYECCHFYNVKFHWLHRRIEQRDAPDEWYNAHNLDGCESTVTLYTP